MYGYLLIVCVCVYFVFTTLPGFGRLYLTQFFGRFYIPRFWLNVNVNVRISRSSFDLFASGLSHTPMHVPAKCTPKCTHMPSGRGLTLAPFLPRCPGGVNKVLQGGEVYWLLGVSATDSGHSRPLESCIDVYPIRFSCLIPECVYVYSQVIGGYLKPRGKLLKCYEQLLFVLLCAYFITLFPSLFPLC